MNKVYCILAALTGLFLIQLQSFAQFSLPGELDTTFNFGAPHNVFTDPDNNPNLGKGATSTSSGFDHGIHSTFIQADGKIIIAGDFQFYNGKPRNRIARLNSNGTLDSTFNPGTGANSLIKSVFVQPDGKIIIGGQFSFFNGTPRNALTRLNSNGSIDSTFVANSGLNGSVYAILCLANGKIMIVGNFLNVSGVSRNRIARLNANGSLDITFNPGSGANGHIYSIAVQPDGKLIIGGAFNAYNGGSRLRIARINVNGLLDGSFNSFGGADDAILSSTLQPNGKVIIGGYFTSFNGVSRNSVARLNANGSLDTSFNPGTGSNHYVSSTAVQQDDKVLIGGPFTSFNGITRNRIARLNSNGSIDTSFIVGSGTPEPVLVTCLQNDGKVLLGGQFTSYNDVSINFFTRLNTNGSLDLSFNPPNGGNSSVMVSSVQTDGKLLIGGWFTVFNGVNRKGIARLNSDGTLDMAFNPGNGANSLVNSISIQPNGKIIISGFFTQYNGVSRMMIARLHENGNLDNSFSPGSGPGGISFPYVFSSVLQSDGKIIVAGEFTIFNGSPKKNIARLNPNGTVDQSFNPGTGSNNKIYNCLLQNDGKIIISGEFTSYNNSLCNRIARLNIDGSLDTSFQTGNGADYTIFDIFLQQDGKIIIAGDFTQYNNTTRIRVARINNNGSLDIDFNPASGPSWTVYSLTAQPDGKVILGGGFQSFNGISRQFLARLNPYGALDHTFDPSSSTPVPITSLTSQPDGRVIVGGSFDKYSNFTRNAITRVISPNCSAIANLTSDSSICQGQTKLLNSPVSGAWVISSGPGSISGTTYTASGGSGRVSIYNEVGGCTSPLVTFNVISLPAPPTIQPSFQICQGNSMTITPISGGVNYRFYTSVLGGSPISTGNGVSSFTTPVLFSTTTYYVSSVSATGCESSTRTPVTVLVNLLPNVVVTIVNDTLRASIIIGAYQWLLDGVIIPGANSSIFVPTVSGNYSAQVTSPQGCVGVSAPVVFIVSGSETDLQNPSTIDVFPNPIGEELHVKSELHFDFVVTDILGNVVLKGQKMAGDQIISTERLASGSYFLQVISERGILNKKLIKQ
jgi:uncharacterized delta-60 repeat protein